MFISTFLALELLKRYQQILLSLQIQQNIRRFESMPRPKVQRNEIKYKYSKHDIVWAKTAGYRWWPASITCVPSRNKYFYKVDFIGDRSYALLSEQKLAPFMKFKDEYQVNKKNDKHFSNAVTIALKKYQELLLKHQSNTNSKLYLQSKTSQLKQQLNQQILLPQIPENIQQISSLSQQHRLQLPQIPPIPNYPKNQTQSCHEFQFIEKPTERTPTQLIKASDSIESEPLSLEVQNRQKFIQEVLAKYKLDRIPELKQYKKSQKQNSSNDKKKNNKRKFIQKSRNSQSQVTQHVFREEELLIRKMYRFLIKKLNSPLESKLISLSLKEQIMCDKLQKVQCFRKLIEWISISDSQNIVQYHTQWINFYKESERQRQKHSNLTMEQQSDPISIK